MDLLKHMIDGLIIAALFTVIPIAFILLTGLVIFGPVILRCVMPCKNHAGKVFATGFIGLLTAAWLVLRLFYHEHSGSHEFIMALTKNPQFVAQDGLLLAAWIALLLSLLLWPGYTRQLSHSQQSPSHR
jgi:Co/Zn/Cd efflux system component